MKSPGILASNKFRGLEAAMPTIQAKNLRATLAGETEMTLAWIGGNGSNKLVIGKQGSPVDSQPVIGVEYADNPVFGLGDELGTGNFVLYAGTENTVDISGLSPDTIYYFDVFEFNADGFNYLTTIDTNTLEQRTAVIFDDTFAFETEAPGMVELKENAYGFWDLSQLTFDDEDTITGTTDPGLLDQTSNGNDLTPGNSPVTNEVTINSESRKGARFGTGGEYLDTGTNGSAWFNNSTGFEAHYVVELADGQPPSDVRLGGTPNTGGIFRTVINTSGQIQAVYQTPGKTTTIESSIVFTNGQNTEVYIRVRMDFASNEAKIFVNGSDVTSSITGTSMADQDPATFVTNINYILGTTNPGNPFVNGAAFTLVRHAITPLLDSEKAADVADVFTFDAVGGFALTDYVVHETEGFTFDVQDNELLISGNPFSWQDWIAHKEGPGATLEEFRVGLRIRLEAEPDTNSAGIGVGIKNDLDAEPNRAVLGEVNFDTDGGAFGRCRIFAGNGQTSPIAIPLVAGSGSALSTPVSGNRYDIDLTRDLAGNDALWVVTVTDLQTGDADTAPDTITTSWTETGRPSSAFFSTTTRFWIHVNGGSYAVERFYVYRIGDDVSPPPPAEDYDIEVAITGNDANPGTLSEPVRTINRAFQLAAGMSSGVTIHIGPGTFAEGSFLSVPSTVAEIAGSGEGLTIVTGQSNLYRNFTQNPSLWLWLINGSSSEDLHIHDITFEGANRQILGALSNNGRSNVTYENLSINNFNFGGIWVQNLSNVTMLDVKFTSAGGAPASGGYSTAPICAADINGMLIDGGFIDGTIYRTGYAFKCLGGSPPNVLQNVEIRNMNISVHGDGAYIDNNGNLIGNINIEFWGVRLNNVKVHDCVFVGGWFSYGFQDGTLAQVGDTHIYNCNFFPGRRPSNNAWISTIEGHVDNLKIYDNYSEARSFIFIFNVNSNGHTYSNWEVYRNYVEVWDGGFGMGALVSSNNHPLINAHIHNNTLVYLTSSGAEKPPIWLRSSQGQSSILVEDNAIYGQPPVNTTFISTSGGSGLTSSTARNNKATHVNTLQSLSGLTGGSGQNNETGLNGSGWFNFSGAKPVPYYALPTNSYLRNKGFGGDHVGAWQG